MKKLLVAFAVLIGLVACEKEELPVSPATSQAITAAMGDDYLNMLYFDVLTGTFVKQLPHTGYDLQFESSPDGKFVFLNSSNFMFLGNMGIVPFEQVTDTISSNPWRYDFPTGEPTRTAIGKWFNPDGTSKNEVFVLNRGYDELGNSRGFVKMQMLSASTTTYKLRIASLDNKQDTIVTVQKDSDKNLVQFDITKFAIEDIEPNKNDWHLHFSQYTDYDLTEEGDTIPYLVRGVLLNQDNCEAIKLENADFASITLADVQNLALSSDRNAIGYDWKAFSLNTGIYEVVPNIVYIVKEASGNYYKLHFVEFYNDNGDKGYPRFEIEGL